MWCFKTLCLHFNFDKIRQCWNTFNEFLYFLLRIVYSACFHLLEPCYQGAAVPRLARGGFCPFVCAVQQLLCLCAEGRLGALCSCWVRTLCTTVECWASDWSGSIHTRTTQPCDDWSQLGLMNDAPTGLSGNESPKHFFFLQSVATVLFNSVHAMTLRCKHLRRAHPRPPSQ